MARSIFSSYGIATPSYVTICRGVRRLVKFLPRLSKRRPRIVLIDSSGFKVYGEGEWKTKVHGKSYRRKWMKVYLLVDCKTNEIIDVITDLPSKGDITGGLEFLEKLPSSVKTILADGAYDGMRFRKKAYLADVEAVIPPPPIDAKISEDHSLRERNEAIKIIAALGGDKLVRKLWAKLLGYNHRVKVESAFSRLKRLFGESLFSRNIIAKKVEVWLKALINNIWINWSGGVL